MVVLEIDGVKSQNPYYLIYLYSPLCRVGVGRAWSQSDYQPDEAAWWYPWPVPRWSLPASSTQGSKGRERVVRKLFQLGLWGGEN